MATAGPPACSQPTALAGQRIKMLSVREPGRLDARALPTPDRRGPAARGGGSEARQSSRSTAPSPAQALALQHAIGNRGTARVLARWAKHPDEKQKGKLVTDGAAAEYIHLNFPLSK
jgi:hypothetical protein